MDYLMFPFVEVEVRLGTITKKGNNETFFDSGIDKNYFLKINNSLAIDTNWKAVEDIHSVEYYEESKTKGVSTRLIESNNKKILSSKENIISKTIQLNNSPFDIRFSVNQEFILGKSELTNSTTIRDKSRKSYISDNFKYDLTFVIQSVNNVKTERYEIEIELLQNDETITWTKEYFNDFLECKIYDLINIVEPIKRDSFKINIH